MQQRQTLVLTPFFLYKNKLYLYDLADLLSNTTNKFKLRDNQTDLPVNQSRVWGVV